jgi:hypothetical protein
MITQTTIRSITCLLSPSSPSVPSIVSETIAVPTTHIVTRVLSPLAASLATVTVEIQQQRQYYESMAPVLSFNDIKQHERPGLIYSLRDPLSLINNTEMLCDRLCAIEKQSITGALTINI